MYLLVDLTFPSLPEEQTGSVGKLLASHVQVETLKQILSLSCTWLNSVCLAMYCAVIDSVDVNAH